MISKDVKPDPVKVPTALANFVYRCFTQWTACLYSHAGAKDNARMHIYAWGAATCGPTVCCVREF